MNQLSGGCSSTLFSTAHSSPGSVLRSSDQLNEIVSLAHVLLPPLADSGTLILEDQPTVADVSGGEAAIPKPSSCMLSLSRKVHTPRQESKV